MRSRFVLLPAVTVLLFMIMVFSYYLFENKPIKSTGFSKITVYLHHDQEGPYVITDEKVIKRMIDKINTSPKEDITKIIFEEGPDGKIIFEGLKRNEQIAIFSEGGNVVTERYLIKTGFNLDEIHSKK